ncbi:alpha/beta hydrolase fold domain-containing protein [Bifidobacterium sp. SO4]|uniref:alpha/beta hydrolase fold domain-containing protein n=1 Tax=Bifidobacterium sp. SO4 TaxID=2809030 RepID=UPI001BDC6AA9|nr:alpha/beta hydrolase fold domain-containing protein [Bifidobacterium sp. SO4]MBT1170592.1 alpha/beta hydrolase [Bifidobacterium sp. SO4]
MSGILSARLRRLLSLIIVLIMAMSITLVFGPIGVANADDIQVQEQMQVQTDIPYMAPWSSSQTQKLDLYSLRGWGSKDTNETHPVVVFIHGGSWVHGDKSLAERMPLVNIFLQQGYMVASIDYRLTTEAAWPAQINDCKSAIRFLRANADTYGIDRERIAVFGESAGAHLAMMMDVTTDDKFVNSSDGNGSVSSNVQAVISDFGISDVSKWGEYAADTADASYAKNLLLGKGYTYKQAEEASPLTYANADAAPILLLHGKNDRIVAYQQTIFMEQKLREVGAKSVYSWYPDDGPHSSFNVFCQNIIAQIKYLDFLDQAFSVDAEEASKSMPVYRLYNAQDGGHLFTTNKNEASVLNQSWAGWKSEGSTFSVEPKGIPDGQTITRLHNNKNDDYLYTSDAAETSYLVSLGWSSEGTFQAPYKGSVSVYRLYNPNAGQHMLVTNSEEKKTMMTHGWRDEGIAFRAYAHVA